MRLLKVDYIPGKRATPCSDILTEFLRSNQKAVEVTDWEGEVSDFYTLYSSLSTMIRRNYKKVCKVSMSGGRVFLEKLDPSIDRGKN